jgi:hypothetical protein
VSASADHGQQAGHVVHVVAHAEEGADQGGYARMGPAIAGQPAASGAFCQVFQETLLLVAR